MQEFKVLNWCDVCFGEDEKRVESTEAFNVTIDRPGGGMPSKPRIIDVCDPHKAMLIAVREVIRKYGRIPKAKADSPPTPPQRQAPASGEPARIPLTIQRGPRDAKVACPVKGCPIVVAPGSLIPHLVGQHDARRPKVPKKCPDCGDRYDNPQGMTTHRARAHPGVILDEVIATLPEKVRP